MSTNTTHYNLKKPQQADKIADTISELGTNMDTIDTQMYANATKIASASELGNIKVGSNLTIDADGTLNASSGGVTDYDDLSNKPQIAGVTLTGNKTLAQLGIEAADATIVKDANYVHTDNNYDANASNKLAGIEAGANNYTLPIAGANTLGGIKVGNNLTIDEDGTLNATGGSGSSTWGNITGTLSDQTDLNTALNGKLGTSGDGQSVTVTFTESATRDAITTGSTLATLFGKIKKWLTDLASVAFSGSYSDLTSKPTSLNDINATEYGKLNGAIQEPASEGTNGQVLTTNGAGGRSWTTVQGGGGTSDHSQLTNLAYAASGHTGFAGTDVTNTFTTVQTIEAESYDGLMLADEDDNTKYTAFGKNGYHYQNGAVSRYVTYSDIIRSDANTNTAIYNVWYGTQAQYEALATKDANTLYFIPEE